MKMKNTIHILLKTSKKNINKNTDNHIIIKFDSLTKDYLNYLTELETEMYNKTTAILFDDHSYSSKGQEFISKNKAYKSEIENLVESDNLKKRINLVLNTDDVIVTDNFEIVNSNKAVESKESKIYIKYLHYYYLGFPENQFLAFLNNKKKSILEIKNEFIITSINQ